MAVAYFTEFPQGSADVALQVSGNINERLGHNPPQGGIYHAEGALPDRGWWTFDVWESEDAYRRFTADILTPALQTVDLSLPQARKLDVHWESNHPQG